MEGNVAYTGERIMATVKFTARMEGKDIDAGIKSLASRGKRFDADVQAIAISIVAHTEAHSDYTKAEALYAALPAGSRRASLVQWFLAFGKIRALCPKVAEDKAKMDAGAIFAFDRDKRTDLLGAHKTMWHSMGKPESKPSEVFDVQKAAMSLLARMRKARKDGVEIKGDSEAVHAALLALEIALKPAGVCEEGGAPL